MTKTYNITGMKCQGCVNTVTEKQRRICKRKTQIKKLKMIKKEEEQKW